MSTFETKVPLQRFTLSASQQYVLDLINQGQSVFFTGPAGCGKSYLLKYIIEQNKHRRDVYVTATTGIAAFAIGGTTVHSFAGLGIAPPDLELFCDTLRYKPKYRWQTAALLIIDEVSMLEASLFDFLDAVARRLRQCAKPWGGLQVVLTGDFLQLPPIAALRQAQFAFKAASWKPLLEHRCVQLEGNFRQTDATFLTVLTKLRQGTYDATVQALLAPCVDRVFPATDLIKPTIVCPRREQVEGINRNALKRLPGPEYAYPAVEWGTMADRARLEKQCPAPVRLVLRKGAQVMLLKNLDVARGLVNGAQGIVESFCLDGAFRYPIVRFTNGVQVPMERAAFELREDRKVIASRSQLPLILAWAMTIHKCQGMTLERLSVRATASFEYGQVYVALSRARSLEGLHLDKPLDPLVIRAHPDAVEFMANVPPPVYSA